MLAFLLFALVVMISPAIYGNCTRLVNQARPRPIAAADSRGRSAASFAPRGCSPASYFPLSMDSVMFPRLRARSAYRTSGACLGETRSPPDSTRRANQLDVPIRELPVRNGLAIAR